jgi:pyridoxamine 5'-phosphate oxidase
MKFENSDPFEIFNNWMDKASGSEHNNPNAAMLATAGRDGRPSARMVLLKDTGPDGFVFYTNLQSRKSRHLRENPYAALLCHWKTQDRQVRIEGPVELVPDAEADDYFASRPRASQLGAWASKQSQPLEGIAELEKRIAIFAAKFHVGPVPRPDFWSGFRLRPERFEFWEEGNFRLHRRHVFIPSRTGDDSWSVQQVFP